MNNTLKSQVCKVKPGTLITGKWHKKSYKVIRALGYGANGIVYLAESTSGLVALKISDNNMSITSEVNVLKHFSKVQGSALGPSLLDVDDWYRSDFATNVPFYIMEYISGETFLSFIEKRGKEWIGILCLQLLSDLERLHQNGWVFGDLKPDNLIVTGHPPKIRCIDVGGTTLQGRSIKEFTEFFDRGYWGAGSRKAEPTYDLFAVAMIIINSAYPKRFSRSANMNGTEQLKQAVKTNPQLKKFEKVLEGAIEGKYQQAAQMRKELVYSISRVETHSSSTPKKTVKPTTNHHTRTQRRQKKPAKYGGIIETLLIVIFVCLGYILYVYGQLL